MGVIQNTINSALGTTAVAVGAGKKFKQDYDAKVHNTVLEQDALESQYLANKDEMSNISQQIKDISSGKVEMDDRMAAQRAIANLQTKLLAKKELNSRIGERFGMIKKGIREDVVRNRQLLTGEEK